MADKYTDTIAASAVATDDSAVSAAVARILEEHLDENRNAATLRRIYNCIDLTTLKATDSPQSVAALTEKVNTFEHEHADIEPVAAICVYPNLVGVVRATLDVTAVKIAAVAGGFPSSQTFTEVKVAETALAVEAGADEIDTVINLGSFLTGDYETVADDLQETKHSCRHARMKVILETGALKSARLIRDASVLALYSGADFLKTSTGKEWPGASLEAAYVMCQCIKEYYEKHGRRVGFKAAGGVTTADEALAYYTVVRAVLGESWVESNEYFRIGASRLADSLLAEIIKED